MKHFTFLFNLPLLIIPLLLISCGRPTTKDCGKNSLDVLCRMLYNETEPTDLTPLENRTSQLEAESLAYQVRLEALEYQVTLNTNDLSLLNSQVSSMMNDISTLTTQISVLNTADVNFQTQLTSLINQISVIQTTVNLLQQSAVAEIVDLCNNHKEILIRLGDGTLIALYAGGHNKHRLQVLAPGSYITTDNMSCHFTVHTNLSVTW